MLATSVACVLLANKLLCVDHSTLIGHEAQMDFPVLKPLSIELMSKPGSEMKFCGTRSYIGCH